MCDGNLNLNALNIGEATMYKVYSVCSSVTAITRSIIQGSVVGPYGFIIYAHDFKVVGLLNSALKYAQSINQSEKD